MQVVLATGGFDHKITLWESNGACIKVLKFPDSQVNCLQVSNDKKILAAGGNSQILLFGLVSSIDTPIHTLDGISGNVTALGFQKDGDLV
jgi:target of rapamycin complex subunit LST8